MKRVILCLFLAAALAVCVPATASQFHNMNTGSSTLNEGAPVIPRDPPPPPTPTPTPEPPLITQAELQQAVDQAKKDYGAMGIQAAVIQDGAVIAQAASGWAVNGQISMTPRHKMRCASLTKVAVGISAGVLMDQGVISPQDKPSDYWGVTVRNPSYPGTPITVDMLLTHTSTLSDASDSLTALLAEDGMYQGQQLLSPETVAFLEQPFGQTPDGFYQCRPLRYRENMYGRDRIYYHTGSSYGFYGLLSYDPDTGDGVVVFTTGASGAKDSCGVYSVCSQVARAVYG